MAESSRDLIDELSSLDKSRLIAIGARCCDDRKAANKIEAAIKRAEDPAAALVKELEGAGLEANLPRAIQKEFGSKSPFLEFVAKYLQDRSASASGGASASSETVSGAAPVTPAPKSDKKE